MGYTEHPNQAIILSHVIVNGSKETRGFAGAVATYHCTHKFTTLVRMIRSPQCSPSTNDTWPSSCECYFIERLHLGILALKRVYWKHHRAGESLNKASNVVWHTNSLHKTAISLDEPYVVNMTLSWPALAVFYINQRQN